MKAPIEFKPYLKCYDTDYRDIQDKVRQLEKDYAELMERNDKNLMVIDMLMKAIEKHEIKTANYADIDEDLTLLKRLLI